MQLRKLFYQAGRAAAGLLVVVFAMTGAAKLADQIVTWLTFAVWQPFTIADALRFWGIPVPQAPQLLDSRNSPMPSCRGPEFRRTSCSPAPAFSCLQGSIASSANSRASLLAHILNVRLT